MSKQPEEQLKTAIRKVFDIENEQAVSPLFKPGECLDASANNTKNILLRAIADYQQQEYRKTTLQQNNILSSWRTFITSFVFSPVKVIILTIMQQPIALVVELQ